MEVPRPRSTFVIALVAAAAVLGAVILTGAAFGTAFAQASAPATTTGCGRPPGLSSGSRTITSAGLNRSSILKVPDNDDRNRPYQLIFAPHRGNGAADGVASGGSDGSVRA